MEQYPQRAAEQHRDRYEQLTQLLAGVAEDINRDLAQRYGLQEHLVDATCTIRPEAFADKPGFDSDELAADRARVLEAEREWSAADDPRVQAFYAGKYGGATPEAIVDWYREERQRSASTRLEMLVTLLFHRAFGEDFLVVRANPYDDYFHGIDSVAINKRTGEAICAFDEVHDHTGSDRLDKKLAKVKRTVAHGGTTLRYGLAVENEQLKLGPAQHLPVFYLSLTTQQLGGALAEVASTAGQLTEAERQLCAQLISSLQGQVEMLQAERAPREVRANLQGAKQAIAAMAARCN